MLPFHDPGASEDHAENQRCGERKLHTLHHACTFLLSPRRISFKVERTSDRRRRKRLASARSAFPGLCGFAATSHRCADFVRSMTAEAAHPSPEVAPARTIRHASGRRKLSVSFSALSGAGDGNRTHDIQLGKLSFYH